MLRRSKPPLGLVPASFAVVFFLLTVASAVILPDTAPYPGVTIKNFGKINEHYFRGSQPKQQEFSQLKKLGIKTVVDLRRDRLREAAEWARAAGLQYFTIPLKPGTRATDDQTNYFLSLVNDPANWPVYVHCKGGKHRTGAMTAVYRIVHDGWTADQAYAEMKDYDFNDGFFGGPDAQKKFVYSFYESHRATGGQK